MLLRESYRKPKKIKKNKVKLILPLRDFCGIVTLYCQKLEVFEFVRVCVCAKRYDNSKSTAKVMSIFYQWDF